MRTRVAVPVLSAVFFGVVLFATSACAAPRGRVYVHARPPAAFVEVRGERPGPRHVWTGGHQRWTGRGYVWAPGVWVIPPRPYAVRVPARWVHERRGWYFVDGHWRR